MTSDARRLNALAPSHILNWMESGRRFVEANCLPARRWSFARFAESRTPFRRFSTESTEFRCIGLAKIEELLVEMKEGEKRTRRMLQEITRQIAAPLTRDMEHLQIQTPYLFRLMPSTRSEFNIEEQTGTTYKLELYWPVARQSACLWRALRYLRTGRVA